MKGLLLKTIILLTIVSCSLGRKCVTTNYKEIEIIENKYGEKFEAKYHIDETICHKYDTTYVLNGKYELFTIDGILVHSANFVKDKYDGELKDFYQNGQIQMISHYRNDTLIEISEIYGNNSELLDSNILINGTGKYKSYYPNNQLGFEYELVKGVKEGMEISYDSTGLKISECEYKADLKNGKFIQYYPNQKIATKCEFQNDILVGEYLEFYESGKMKSKVVYKYPPYNHQDSLHLRLIPSNEDDILSLLDAFDPGGYYRGVKKEIQINYDENGNEIEN